MEPTTDFSPAWIEARRRLPTALAWLETGFSRGSHVGAQVFVQVGDSDPVVASTGQAAPGVPMSDATLVNPLCGSKPLVAAAVARAVDHGLVSPGEPVSRFLPSLRGTKFDNVTLAGCLSHPIAGFDRARERELGDPEAPLPGVIRAILDSVAREPDPRAVAGTYVAWPFGLVAATLEVLYGEPFESVLRQQVFLPLGMGNTWVGMPEATAARYEAAGLLAKTFDCTAEKPRVAGDGSDPWRTERGWGMPTEGFRTSSREMGRFYVALMAAREGRDGQWLATAPAWLMTTRHQVATFDHYSAATVDFGLGVMLEGRYHDKLSMSFGPDCSLASFGHAGLASYHGFCDPDRRLVVSVFLNGQIGDMAHGRRVFVLTQKIYNDLELT